MEDYIDFNNFLFRLLCNSFIFQFKSTSGLGFFFRCNLNTFVDSAAHSKGLFRSLRLEKLWVPAGLCSQHLQGRAWYPGGGGCAAPRGRRWTPHSHLSHEIPGAAGSRSGLGPPGALAWAGCEGQGRLQCLGKDFPGSKA